MVSDPLAIDALCERHFIQINQMHFAVGLEKRGEVEVVTVSRPEDAEPARARLGSGAEDRGNVLTVAGESVPLVAALSIESGLPSPGVVHGFAIDKNPSIRRDARVPVGRRNPEQMS